MSRNQEIRQQEQAQRANQQLLQNMEQPDSPGERAKYLNELLESDLDAGKFIRRELQAMLSPDFVLSNLSSAEVDEMKWLNEITFKKLLADMPDEHAIAGEARAKVYDDESERVPRLRSDERVKFDIFKRGVHARTARSKEGFQQEEVSKTYSVSEIADDEESGGWLDFS